MSNMGGTTDLEHSLARIAGPAEGDVRSTDNLVAAVLEILAQEPVTAPTARLYLGHLQRFVVWLRPQY